MYNFLLPTNYLLNPAIISQGITNQQKGKDVCFQSVNKITLMAKVDATKRCCQLLYSTNVSSMSHV